MRPRPERSAGKRVANTGVGAVSGRPLADRARAWVVGSSGDFLSPSDSPLRGFSLAAAVAIGILVSLGPGGGCSRAKSRLPLEKCTQAHTAGWLCEVFGGQPRLVHVASGGRKVAARAFAFPGAARLISFAEGETTIGAVGIDSAGMERSLFVRSKDSSADIAGIPLHARLTSNIVHSWNRYFVAVEKLGALDRELLVFDEDGLLLEAPWFQPAPPSSGPRPPIGYLVSGADRVWMVDLAAVTIREVWPAVTSPLGIEAGAEIGEVALSIPDATDLLSRFRDLNMTDERRLRSFLKSTSLAGSRLRAATVRLPGISALTMSFDDSEMLLVLRSWDGRRISCRVAALNPETGAVTKSRSIPYECPAAILGLRGRRIEVMQRGGFRNLVY